MAATIRTSHLSKPYHVTELNIQDFFDFKRLSENFDSNANDEKVYWNSIRTISFKSNTPNKFDYQTDYDDPIYTVDILQKLRSTKLCFNMSSSVTRKWGTHSKGKIQRSY